MNSAFAVQLLLEHYPIITLDGERVRIVPDEDSYHYHIKFVDPQYGKMDSRLPRHEFLEWVENDRIKFYQEVNITSDLQAALYDYD